MLHIDSIAPFDIERYEKDINMSGFDVYVEPNMYNNMVNIAHSQYMAEYLDLGDLLTYYSIGEYNYFTKESVFHVLVDNLGVPDKFFLTLYAIHLNFHQSL